MPQVSVIIPTRNRADLLDEMLGAMMAQTLPSDAFEVIVINNGSTDRTIDVTARAVARFAHFKVANVPAPGLHNGRHAGMALAQSDILVFADDDVEPFPTWLASILEAFENPQTVLVGGNNIPLFLAQPPRWLTRMWELSDTGGGKALPDLSILNLPDGIYSIDPFLVWGCNFAVRRQVLHAAGGFNPDGMPGELLKFRGDGETHVARYVAENGLGAIFHSGASVRHKIVPSRMTVGYFYKRGFFQGVSDSFSILRAGDKTVGASSLNAIRNAGSRRRGRWLRRLNLALGGIGLLRAKFAYRQGHIAGYKFHQLAYETDSEVKNWVHRPNYLERVEDHG